MKTSSYVPVVCTLLFALSINTAIAKVWRVNNNAGVNADFVQLTAAIAHTNVQAGDTIYIEGSSAFYNSVNLTKRLVIIGPGYHLSGNGANAGLQALQQEAVFTNFDIDSLASGSTIMGIEATMRLAPGIDNLTLTRCDLSVQAQTPVPDTRMTNLVINKCYLSINLRNMTVENPVITNCIVSNGFVIPTCINGLVRNNTITGSTLTINSSYIANNIFINSSLTVINCTVKYNMANNTALPVGNNNQNSVSSTVLFVDNVNSNDGRYLLRSGSPAIHAGEPVGGVTPDIGAFGTADPYRLSGIPPIPTIYTLTVPTSVPSTATTMAIMVSTRSNN